MWYRIITSIILAILLFALYVGEKGKHLEKDQSTSSSSESSEAQSFKGLSAK